LAESERNRSALSLLAGPSRSRGARLRRRGRPVPSSSAGHARQFRRKYTVCQVCLSNSNGDLYPSARMDVPANFEHGRILQLQTIQCHCQVHSANFSSRRD